MPTMKQTFPRESHSWETDLTETVPVSWTPAQLHVVFDAFFHEVPEPDEPSPGADIHAIASEKKSRAFYKKLKQLCSQHSDPEDPSFFAKEISVPVPIFYAQFLPQAIIDQVEGQYGRLEDAEDEATANLIDHLLDASYKTSDALEGIGVEEKDAFDWEFQRAQAARKKKNQETLN